MKQGQGSKRARGRNGGRRGANRQQTFDSNGPSVRIRGNAFQVHEKYLGLARDAASSGDRIAAENYYQHAEHYFRLYSIDQEQRNERQAANAQPNDGQRQDDGQRQGAGQRRQGGRGNRGNRNDSHGANGVAALDGDGAANGANGVEADVGKPEQSNGAKSANAPSKSNGEDRPIEIDAEPSKGDAEAEADVSASDGMPDEQAVPDKPAPAKRRPRRKPAASD
ncbi:MAG: DUF4167 domain-containing protein [Rhodospirillaceae bacterium]